MPENIVAEAVPDSPATGAVEASIATLLSARGWSRTQALTIGLCVLINMLDGFDVMAVAYAAPSLAHDWSLGPAALGAVFGAGAAGTALGAATIAPFADVIGRRSMILLSLAVLAVTMLTTALVQTTAQLVAIRAVNGLAIGAMLASLTALCAEYAPDRHRNTALGVVHSGYLLGAIVGGAASAWIIPQFGWPAVFVLCGALIAVVLPVAAWLLPESVQYLMARRPRGYVERTNVVLRRLEISPIAERVPPPPGGAVARPGVRSVLAPSYRVATLRLWSAFFLVFLTLYFVQSWIPKIVADRGLSLTVSIYAGVAVNFGGIIGSVALGLGSAKVGLRAGIAGYLVLGVAAMLALGSAAPSAAMLIALCFLSGTFVLGAFIGLYMAAARTYPAAMRGTGVGWAVGAGRLGAVVSPYLAGAVIAMETPLSLTFLVFALPLVVATGVVAFAAIGVEPTAPDALNRDRDR
jgi:AAHS family 4-hydroxybenzoate transporter-like MFS transporter